MSKPLRFTGENPPRELWRKYPNWRNALEEEGAEGQDETTLMPHEVQTHIGEYTSFTAGVVRLQDGHDFPAFLALGRIGIDSCEVYQTDAPWRIYYDYPRKRWIPFRAEWLPAPHRAPCVSFDDDAVFPLEIRMIVPWQEGGRPASYQITKDGEMREIAG